MYELKCIEGLTYRYFVDPNKPEIIRVNDKGEKRILHSCTLRSGYKLVKIRVNGVDKLFYEHRIVWMAVNNKPIPKGYQINHKDYNRGNNKIDNLEIMTVQENLRYSNKNRALNKARKIKLTNNGKYVDTFISYKACADYLGVPSYRISDFMRTKCHSKKVKVDNNGIKIIETQDIRKYSSGNKAPRKARKVKLYHNGEYINTFISYKACAEYLGIPSYKISDSIKGKAHKNGIDGYTFIRIEEDKK